MMRIAGRVTTVVSTVIAVVTLALVAGAISGRLRMLPVLSGSMSPGFPVGSAAFVTPEPLTSVRVGQVVVYRIPVLDHRLVMHRVVRLTRPGVHPVIRTRGDANPIEDPWKARLSGRTIWVAHGALPFAGYVIEGLRSPITLLGVGLMLVGIALASYAVREHRNREDDIWWQT
jgi:signal peptidase